MMNPNCNRDPLTCRCWYHQGHVDEPPTPTKPVVTQADRDAAADYLVAAMPWAGGDARIAEVRIGRRDADPAVQALAAHRLASQAVVSQDLVPVAWAYQFTRLDGKRDGPLYFPAHERRDWAVSHPGWTETPLYPASAIEAAQIAARNDALDEAADKLHETIASEFKGFWDAEDLVEEIPAIIRSLRTPSQHQEEQ